MQRIAIAVACALGLTVLAIATTGPDTVRKIKTEKTIELDREHMDGVLGQLLKQLGRGLEIDVNVEARSSHDDGLPAWDARSGSTSGTMKIATIGPNGKRRVKTWNLDDHATLIESMESQMDDVDFDELIEAIDRDPEIREHVMELMRQGFHMPEGMNPLDAHRRNDGHREEHGDMDPEIREHVMEMMRQGFHMPEGMNPLDAHRRNDRHREEHGDPWHDRDHESHHGDQPERREHLERALAEAHEELEALRHELRKMREHLHRMEGEGRHEPHDEGAEHFKQSAESFIEQLQYAKAVGSQLADDTGVALLGIWFASESIEPDQCLEMMVSIMNDEAIARNVRRAAAFVAIDKARQTGNEEDAARILGAIIRGAGTDDG